MSRRLTSGPRWRSRARPLKSEVHCAVSTRELFARQLKRHADGAELGVVLLRAHRDFNGLDPHWRGPLFGTLVAHLGPQNGSK